MTFAEELKRSLQKVKEKTGLTLAKGFLASKLGMDRRTFWGKVNEKERYERLTDIQKLQVRRIIEELLGTKKTFSDDK